MKVALLCGGLRTIRPTMAVCAAALCCMAAFAQGKVAYQSYVDAAVAGVRSTANNASTKVDALNAVVIGDDFAITVTNYDSVTKLPTAKFRFKKDDGTWREVWNELDHWKWFFNTWWPSNAYTKAQTESRFAEKAWGQYTSGLGEQSPDGRLWLTQPVVVSSGLEWVPFNVESGGAIWVLTANGLTPGVSTNGFLRITDDSGKEIFKIVKGDKELVGAFCEGISVSGNVMTLSYRTDSQPTLEGCADLANPEWKDPEESGCTVSWSGTDPYVATVTVPQTFTKYFVRGKYERGKESRIVNTAPTQITGGLVTADGVKIVPKVSGSTVTWEVVTE